MRVVSNALEVTQFFPNFVSINNTGLGLANAYNLRGLGNTESIAAFDPPVGTYLDDIYLQLRNFNKIAVWRTADSNAPFLPNAPPARHALRSPWV